MYCKRPLSLRALTDAAQPLLAPRPNAPSRPPTTTRSPVIAPAQGGPGEPAPAPPVIVEADPWGLADFDPPPSLPVAPVTPFASTEPSKPGYPSLDPTSTGASDLAHDGRVRFSTLRFLGQSRATYLLCEGLDALYVIDQHAAAERVTFHRLKTATAARAAAMQPLLFPKIVEAPETDVALVDEHHDELLAAGIDARAAGAKQIAIHGIPQILRKADPTGPEPV